MNIVTPKHYPTHYPTHKATVQYLNMKGNTMLWENVVSELKAAYAEATTQRRRDALNMAIDHARRMIRDQIAASRNN